MKRKGSLGESAETKGTNKRRKREKKSESTDSSAKGSKNSAVDELKTKLDISSPDTVFKSILSPHSVDVFQDDHWEKKPLHIKRNDPDYYGNLFSFETLMKVLDKNQLNYEVDLNACRYVNGEKEMLNGEDVAKASEVRKLVEKQNATIQFHQPQRFSDALWEILEALEKYFGSHVGANIYITPPGAQGLAPHNDDIEAFVMQLEGKKKWKLYKPLQELAREYSDDLSPEEIGEKTHEIELEPGDLLYFPRGIIHQAETTSDSLSTHITLSTYQTNTWGDFLLDGISGAIETALSKDVEFRRGLPLNYLSLLGTGKSIDEYVATVDDSGDEKNENGKANGDEKPASKSPKKGADTATVDKFKTKIKELLGRVIDHFDPNTVVDSRSEDFIANRLPPFKKATDDEVGSQPTNKSSIKLLYPDHLRLVVYEEDDDDEFDATAEEESDDEDMIEDDEEEEEDDEKKENTEEDEEKPKAKATGKQEKSEKTGKPKSKSAKGKTETSEDEEMEEDIDEDNILQGPHVRLLFSVHNPRETHMIGGVPEPNAVKLPLHFGKAISYLLENHSKHIPLKDLPLTDDNDKLELATTLWTEKLVSIQ